MNEILNSLPYLKNANPKSGGIFSLIYNWFYCLFIESDMYITGMIIFVSIISLITKQKEFGLIISLALSIILMAKMYSLEHSINYVVYPLTLLCPICLLYKDKRITMLFKYVWIPGILYSFCVHVASTQYQYNIFGMCIISTIATLCMLAIIIEEEKNQLYRKLYILIFCITVLSQIGSEAYLRWNNVFCDTNIRESNILITNGIKKGIYVSEGKYNKYYETLNSINNLNLNGNSVLYLSTDPMLYLFKDAYYLNSSHDSWFQNNPQKILDYYEINPKKIPDNIYYPNDHKDFYDDIINELIKKYNFVEVNTQADGRLFYREY